MKQFFLASLLASIACLLAGCGSGGTQTMAPETQPAQGTFKNAITTNPNMPDSAKDALMNKRPNGTKTP